MSIWEKDVIENVSIIKTFHGYVLRTFKYDTYFTSQMNLFKNLRTNYGQGTIKIVRKAENTTCQIARHRNHLVFNLRCKGECVIPPSLRLKCPINSDKARNIVERTRKNFLPETIDSANKPENKSSTRQEAAFSGAIPKRRPTTIKRAPNKSSRECA